MVLSQTKVHGTESPSVTDAKGRVRTGETSIALSPDNSSSIHFCRQSSFIPYGLYFGSASLPSVHFKVLFLKLPWGFSGFCVCTCFLPVFPVSLHSPFLLFMYSVDFYCAASFFFFMYLFSVPSSKPVIFNSQSFPKIKPFSWWFFFSHLKNY